jgi:hypothetical protein
VPALSLATSATIPAFTKWTVGDRSPWPQMSAALGFFDGMNLHGRSGDARPSAHSAQLVMASFQNIRSLPLQHEVGPVDRA